MKNFTEELLNIAAKMLLAKERGDMVRLAGELNGVIEKSIEFEIAPEQSEKTKTSSTTVKFTLKEIERMSRTFKKEFIANGLVSHVIIRPSGKKGKYYEIRYRRNGYNITVSHKDLKKAKELFVEATRQLDSPEKVAKNKLKFGTIADEWIEYKKGKVAFQTWQNYASHAQSYFSEELRETPIKEIRTVDLDRLMHRFDDQPRMYEEMRILLNSIFKYARASGIISHNPVELVPFKRAPRKARRALTDEEAAEYLKRLQEPYFERIRNFAYLLYFFGLRPCEIDEETRIENGFLIARNRKRKGGKIEYKKIPVPKQAYDYIDFAKPLTSPLSYDRTANILREALGKDLNPYNLRHTFASACAMYVPQEIVEIWIGDSPERLIGKTYVHYTDDFMKKQMEKVIFPQ